MKSVKAAPSHPTYLKMIHEAIASIKDRKGASRQAIKAFIAEVRENEVFLPCSVTIYKCHLSLRLFLPFLKRW